MKKLIGILLFTISLFLTACGDSNTGDPNAVRVGVLKDAEQKWLNTVKDVAKNDYDLHIQFVGYATLEDLSKALAAKEIDTTTFQSHVFVEYIKRKNNYHFTELGRTYLFPIGIYSKKLNNLIELKDNAVIAIPQETTNEARALFLLDKVGLIRLKSNQNVEATAADIIDNPHHFQILELPAREVVNILPKVDIGVINMVYAVAGGLVPSKDDIALENQMPDYANVIVVREGEERDPRLTTLLDVIRSAKVQQVIAKTFYGQVTPAWENPEEAQDEWTD